MRSLTRTESRSGAARDPTRLLQQRHHHSGGRAAARKLGRKPGAERGRGEMESWEIDNPPESTTKGGLSMQNE